MRLWHKDLIQLLPDDLLAYQLQDCIDISWELGETGTIDTEEDKEKGAVSRITNYLADEFYSYFILVKNEIIRRRLPIEIDDYEKIFIYNLDKYSGRLSNYTLIDQKDLFNGWHSTRYLQQCILMLEEQYDYERIGLKDWFRITNGVRNMSVLCDETFETLFT